MNLFPNLKHYSTYSWLVLVGTGVFGAFSWNLHFIIEFSTLINSNASSFIFIIFHLFFISLGSISYIFLFRNLDSFVLYLISSTTLCFSMVTMLFVNKIWLISLLLGIAGYSIGIGLVVAHYNLIYFFENPQMGARMYSLALMSIAPFMIIEAFIDRFARDKKWINLSFLVLILILIFSSILVGKRKFSLFSQEEEKVELVNRIGKYGWSSLFALFWGFFFTNTYYSTILLFQIYELTDYLYHFVIEVAFIFFLFSYPVGLLADIIGRRITVTIGFIIQALAFLLLPFISDINSYLLIFFPLTIGLGFTFSIISGIVLMFETTPKKKFKLDFSIHIIFVGLGMSSGVLLGEIIKSTIQNEPMYLSLILLFIIIMAVVVLSQINETLPSKKELSWRQTLRYILVFSHNGTLLYNYEFSANKLKFSRTNSLVLAGALKAMTTLIQEMADNEEQLKIIKQEEFSILIESSTKILTAVIATEELSETRERMKLFNQEFEFVFEDVLSKKIEEQTFYQSANLIIQKVFGERT
ncbi:MAG: MFS transporter [Candidatus Heimdallarchaeum endolithica]|uniref:MFS transporter n=1 Tax=Candidatus Heimdallarchaeum endolithica TaxID=2876572 RepID=A0A9Y1BQ61_9ARCH|nr:MAG: MFS transporter [Candidatus Heimdallarchaeum endolithica]